MGDARELRLEWTEQLRIEGVGKIQVVVGERAQARRERLAKLGYFLGERRVRRIDPMHREAVPAQQHGVGLLVADHEGEESLVGAEALLQIAQAYGPRLGETRVGWESRDQLFLERGRHHGLLLHLLGK